MINKINSGQSINSNVKFESQKTTKINEEKSTEKKDIIDFSNNSKTSDCVTYTKNQKLSATEIEALKKEVDKATENLRSLVEKLILKQSKKVNSGQKVDAETIEEAKKAISEDGEYGIKAVSERIANFAIAACGNDKNKLGEMKAAIDQGFAEAKKAFGGTLPDICGQTYDAIMQKLDDWEKGYPTTNE